MAERNKTIHRAYTIETYCDSGEWYYDVRRDDGTLVQEIENQFDFITEEDAIDDAKDSIDNFLDE
jgi:hypothetical protein